MRRLFILVFVLIAFGSFGQNLAKRLQAVDDYIIQENYDYAEQLLGKILRRDNGVHQAHYKLATVYRLQNQPKKAVEEAVKAVQLKPEEPNYNALLGAIWLALDEEEKGFRSIEKALIIDSLLPEALLYRADYLMETEEYAKAIKDYKSLQKVVSKEPQIQYRLGFCQMQLGKRYLAETSFKKVLEINPVDLEAREMLAQCQYDLGFYTDAIFQIDQLEKLQPAPKNLILRAKCNIKLNKLIEAKQDLLTAQKSLKADFDIAINLIAVEELMHNYQAALKQCNLLMAQYPTLQPLKVLKGRLLAKMGLYNDATRSFGLAINGIEKQDLPFVSQVHTYINLCSYLSNTNRSFFPNGCDSFSFYTFYFGNNQQQQGWTYPCTNDGLYITFKNAEAEPFNLSKKMAFYLALAQKETNLKTEIDLLEKIRSNKNYEQFEYHIADILLNAAPYR